MSHIERNALVHYSPAEMYQLVNDIDAYSSFLPWCKSSQVIESSDSSMTASIEIAKGVLNKTFTTCNILEVNHRIEIALVDGPFKKLKGQKKYKKAVKKWGDDLKYTRPPQPIQTKKYGGKISPRRANYS